VEILVVVIVIAILAAVIVPNMVKAGDTARVAATAEDLRTISDAVERYRNSSGRWPRDVNRAAMPPELESIFGRANPFDKSAAVGGVFDYEGPTASRGPRLSIRPGPANPVGPESMLRELDEFMDDGNLATGRIRMSGAILQYWIAGN
jgi:type II secretory pathway pseudopilin PulG